MKNLVVRCEGNGEVAVVAVNYDLAANRVCIAELVRPDVNSLTRRVSPEVLDLRRYPELEELMSPFDLEWNMGAVEDLVIGYLNRQSDARVRLNQAWESGLGHEARSIG